MLFGGGGFAEGVSNWSWSTSVATGATVDGKSGSNVTYNAAWGGLSLKLNSAHNPSTSQGVAITLKGTGQNLTLWLGDTPSTKVSVVADSSLKTVCIPWNQLGSPSSVNRVTLQENGGSAQAAFFVDNFYLYNNECSSNTPQTPAPEPAPETPEETRSLRELADARGILLGAVTRPDPLSQESVYADIVRQEFNMVSPEGSFLISEMHDPADPFVLKSDLSKLDTQIDYALAGGAEAQAFHLVWFLEGSWAPWLNDIPQDKRRYFIEKRIQDVMARYKGKIEYYNVVNEAFEKDGSLRGQTTADITNWLYEPDATEKYGYIEYSFKQARKANPDAKLFYNDYGINFDGPKWDAVLEMVTYFKAQGIPIDGVGFQTHLNMKWGPLPNPAELAKHMQQLEDLGLETRVTEFDLGIETGDNDAYASYSEAERLDIQAQYYKDYLNVCLNAGNCTAFQMWGFTDKHSWITQPQWGGSPAAKPLIYDANYQPKKAYYALQDALLGR